MTLLSPTDRPARGRDRYGSGAYGASRGGGRRRHEGLDLIAVPGQVVWAPAACRFVRESRPYGDGKAGDSGVLLAGLDDWAGWDFYLWYITVSRQVREQTALHRKQPIGFAVSLQSRYDGITDHVHFGLRRSGVWMDPTPYIFPDDPSYTGGAENRP